MPFLLAEILNFQGSTHHIGVGSFSSLFIVETVSSFVYTLKTDIRFVNSYKWAEPIFQILPLSALYRSF